jgi:hypothetical protein
MDNIGLHLHQRERRLCILTDAGELLEQRFATARAPAAVRSAVSCMPLLGGHEGARAVRQRCREKTNVRASSRADRRVLSGQLGSAVESAGHGFVTRRAERPGGAQQAVEAPRVQFNERLCGQLGRMCLFRKVSEEFVGWELAPESRVLRCRHFKVGRPHQRRIWIACPARVGQPRTRIEPEDANIASKGSSPALLLHQSRNTLGGRQLPGVDLPSRAAPRPRQTTSPPRATGIGTNRA